MCILNWYQRRAAESSGQEAYVHVVTDRHTWDKHDNFAFSYRANSWNIFHKYYILSHKKHSYF